MLSRREVLALSAAAGAAGLLERTASGLAAPLRYDLQAEKLTDGIWMVAGRQEAITRNNGGAIANITILDSKAGAIVIDTGPSRLFGEALAQLATDLTASRSSVSTTRTFIPIMCLEIKPLRATRSRRRRGDRRIDRLWKRVFRRYVFHRRRLDARTEVITPGQVLDREVEDFGDRRLRPLPMRGHTSSDLALFDEASGYLFAGDLVFLDRAPTTPHADIERWRMSLANLGGIPHRRLVPGHGPAENSTRGLDQTRRWLETIPPLIRDAFEKGLDISEATALPCPIGRLRSRWRGTSTNAPSIIYIRGLKRRTGRELMFKRNEFYWAGAIRFDFRCIDEFPIIGVLSLP